MNQRMLDIFHLEKNLSLKKPEKFLSSFQKILSLGKKTKLELTDNPGITLYIPENCKNLHRKNNVLIAIHELSRTGAPIVAIDTAKTLAKNDFFVTVITMRRGPLLVELLDYGIPVIFDQELALAHDSEALLGDPSIPLYIDTFLNAFDKTIIITAVYYNLIRRCTKTENPILWWLHEGTATYDNFAPLMPQKLPSNVKVYTGGKYALEQLKTYQLPYHGKVLNYGVKDSLPQPNNANCKDTKIRPSSSQPDQTVTFILPGSIGKRKGQQLLLDSIELLPDSYRTKCKFIFIGDVTSQYDIDGKRTKAKLIEICQKNANIEYITSVSRTKLFEIYQNIDVLVIPSLDDPMPVVATEALMLKKVVLCSNTTGTSYYLQDNKNGFIFETNNANSLRDKIKYIVDHSDQLAKIGANGRKVYENNFEMNIFEQNLLKTLKGLS